MTKKGIIHKTSIAIEKDDLKFLKMISVEKEITQTRLINDYIKTGIRRDRNQCQL